MTVEEIMREIKKLDAADLLVLNLDLLQWYGRIFEEQHLSEKEVAQAKKIANHIIGEFVA